MPTATHPTTDREVTMSSFTATVSAADEADAVVRVEKYLSRVPGFGLTGRTGVRSARHGLYTVEIAGNGDKNDCWVVLTSYGISPSNDLGSVWQTVPGVGKFD